MTFMRDARPRADWWVAIAAGGVLLLPVIYLLSIGPAVWLSDRGLVSDRVEFAYYPLIWLAERTEWFVASLRWYIELWRG